MSDSTTKHCPKCGQELPRAAFGPNRTQHDGLTTYCRECDAEYRRAYRERNRDRMADYQREWAAKNPDKVRAKTQRWRKKHPDRDRASKERAKAKNPTYHAEHYQKNKERYREQGAAYYEANKEQVQARHRAHYQANRIAYRKYYTKRRAIKRRVTIGKVDYMAVLVRDGWVCHICGDLVLREELSFDHIIPLSKGGKHSNANLAVAHLRCNKRKGARLYVISAAPPRVR